MCKQDWRSTIFLVLYGLSHILACDLPPEIKKCKAGDHVCITQTMNDIIRLYPDGNPLFNMPSLKLVKLDKLIVSKSDSKAPLQLNFQLFDIKITGLDKAKILGTKGFEKDTEYHEVEFQVPFVKMNARYEINGKLLLLPVKGTGHGEFTHKDLHIILKHKIALEKRKGKNYIKTIKLWTSSKPESSTYDFENLFDGNKELADATNKVLTENSQDVWNAMGEEFSRGIAQVIEELLLPTLECLAYDDFFAE
ncbi:protein takeout-like isoform 2-T2 [Glossina fuscipes fuscipes]